MKTILITSPVSISREVETIAAAFQNGLDFLHVRKPDWHSDAIGEFIHSIPDEFLQRTVIHGLPWLAQKCQLGGVHLQSHAPLENLQGWRGMKSRSAHQIHEIEEQQGLFDYFFLSPVFDSISKPGYRSRFDEGELGPFLHKKRSCDVYALGGIDEDKTDLAKILGFDGVALLGAVWQKQRVSDRVKVLTKVMQKCRQTAGTY